MADELKMQIDAYAKNHSSRIEALDTLLETELSAIAKEVIEGEGQTEA